jgi:hypothetical protein
MKNIIYILVGAFLLSCSEKQKETRKVKCEVISSEKIPIVSVMDEISRRNKWRVKTDCWENTFVVEKQYCPGDSIEIEVVTFR